MSIKDNIRTFLGCFGKIVIGLLIVWGLLMMSKCSSYIAYKTTKVYVCSYDSTATYHIYDYCEHIWDCDNIEKVKLPEIEKRQYRVCEDCYQRYEYERERNLEKARERRMY